MLTIAAVLAVMLTVNLLNNRWAREHYLIVCLATSVVLIGIARAGGVTLAELGLSRSTLANGLLWSAVVTGVIVAGYAIAFALPWTRKGFLDDRAAEHSWRGLLYHGALRIPLGTALMEEVAFRGVLLALLATQFGIIWAVAISSVVFGVWHVLPSLEFHAASAMTDRLGDHRRAQLTSVIGTVVGTGIAGVGFCLLRIWTDSLLPCIAAHAALNGVGFVLSWSLAKWWRRREAAHRLHAHPAADGSLPTGPSGSSGPTEPRDPSDPGEWGGER